MKKNHIKLIAAALLLSLTAQAQISTLNTNRVEINMSQSARDSLRKPTKTIVPDAEIKIYRDGQLIESGKISINSRGQSSISKARKNFGIETKTTEDDKKAKMHIGSVSGKSLLLSAGAKDPLIIKNMLAYRLLHLVDVPALESDYLEVIINNESEGLYMVTRTASDHVLKHDDSKNIAVFRRRYNDVVELKKAKKDLPASEIKAIKAQLTDMHRSLRKYKGQEKINFLSKQLNLDHYLRAMAINYLLHNADVADEMFYSVSKLPDGSYYFDILPWDLDDSFLSQMHLQNIPLHFNKAAAKRGKPAKQLIYNYEGRIEQAVSEDPVLMKLYFDTFETMLDEDLTQFNIDAAFREVSQKLNPYLEERAVLENGIKDVGAAYAVEDINADLAAKKQELEDRIASSRQVIGAAVSGNQYKTKKISWISKKIGFFEMNLIQKIMSKKEKKADRRAEEEAKLFQAQ